MAVGEQRLTLTRLLPAPREQVFAAWTTPEIMREWMCPADVEVVLVEMDLRVGGEFRIDMLAGGERLVHRGTYRQIDPPQTLVFTWISVDTYGGETVVRVDLRERGNGTQLTLTQTLLPDSRAVERHTRGWSQILDRLALWCDGR